MHPAITINGQVFNGDYLNTNELFKLICSKLQHRPVACQSFGLADEKKKIMEDYEKEWGADGSIERAVINLDMLKENQRKGEEQKSIHDRKTTKLDLAIVLIVFICATAGAFYYKNYREKTA